VSDHPTLPSSYGDDLHKALRDRGLDAVSRIHTTWAKGLHEGGSQNTIQPIPGRVAHEFNHQGDDVADKTAYIRRSEPSEPKYTDPLIHDQVNHPRHYNQHPAGIECIDVIEHFPANIAFAIKHLWRVGLKPGSDPLTDISKAIWYLERERQRLYIQITTVPLHDAPEGPTP
jgi:hypothetical protein